MTEQQAIEESIAHWERMIELVEKYCEKDEPPSPWDMYKLIGEGWGGGYCPLCQQYSFRYGIWVYCFHCPLFIKYGPCTDLDSQNAWHRVTYSSTWAEWLTNAQIMLEQLKSLREM